MTRKIPVRNTDPWVTVKPSSQTLLIQEMGNQTNAATQDKQSIEDTHAQVVLGLLRRKGTASTKQVYKADCYGSVDVENQIVLLAGGHGLNSLSVVEQCGAGEVLVDKLLDERDTEIGVVS